MEIINRLKQSPPVAVTGGMDAMKKHQFYCSFIDDIHANGTELKFQHRTALGELACTYHEMCVCREDLAVRGEHVEVTGDRKTTITKANPSRQALDKLSTRFDRLMKAFLMTPDAERTGRKSDRPVVPNTGDDALEGI